MDWLISVFYPSENQKFGLVEIKCPYRNYVDYLHLNMHNEKLEEKQQHVHDGQVQGQRLITGLQRCHFVVCAEEDTLIQHMYRDSEVMQVIKENIHLSIPLLTCIGACNICRHITIHVNKQRMLGCCMFDVS